MNKKYISYLNLIIIILLVIMNIKSKADEQKFINNQSVNDLDTTYFGAGCFWCTESIFMQLKGVIALKSGYSGGKLENPTYNDICYKNTGHAEVVKIIFNTEIISYGELLEIFWEIHDPTSLNKQGADIGTQYRSVIFYTNKSQQQKAEFYKNKLNLNKVFDKPIVTAIEPYKNFYPAEEYHQNYYNKNTNQGYCQFVIKPKLEKFKKIFKLKLKN